MIEKKRIVLLGKQGSGKTTLFNKLTGQNYPTRLTGSSLTRNIVMDETQHGKGFQVVDTPGFDVSEEKVLHAAGIVAGLTFGQLNRIVIVVKMSRDEFIKTDIRMVYKVIQRYQSNITIYFTGLDQAEDPKNDPKKLIELAKQNFKISSVLFGSKQDNQKSITDQFDNILMQSNFIDVTLLEAEIAQISDYIKFANEEEFEKMENTKSELSNQFNKYIQIFQRFIEKLKLEEIYFLEILHQLQFYIKDTAYKVLIEFEEKYRNIMDKNYETSKQNYQYLHHIVLKKQLFSLVEQIQNKVQNKMQTHKDHIYQYLRECPNCGLVWMKVIGCEKVVCGNEVGAKEDQVLNIDIKSSVVFEIKNDELKFIIQKGELIGDEVKITQILKFFFDNQLPRDLKEKLKLKNFEQFIQLLKEKITNQNCLRQWSQKLELQEKDKFLERLHEILINFSNNKQESQLKKVKNLGCGKSFDWIKEGRLISGEHSCILLGQGLYDFFSDYQKLQSEELQFLMIQHKETMVSQIQIQKQKYQNQEVKSECNGNCQIF